MDEYKDKRYIKEIIKEYNILLESWGSSESWDLNQFKTLENMIFETTKIDVNANTLKRFFQQKTGNPQLATKDALCRFLGYSGYTDFVMKKTKKEETTNIQTEDVVEETKEHTNDTDKKADSSQLEKAPNKVTKDPEEVSNRIYKKNKWYVNFPTIVRQFSRNIAILSTFLLILCLSMKNCSKIALPVFFFSSCIPSPYKMWYSKYAGFCVEHRRLL